MSFWILKMNQQLNGVWMKWYLLYFSTKILFFKFFLLIIFAIKMLFQNIIISNFCRKYTFTMLRFHAGFEIKLPLVANSLLKENWNHYLDEGWGSCTRIRKDFTIFLKNNTFCYFENMSSTIFFLQRLVSIILPQDILSNDWDM